MKRSNYRVAARRAMSLACGALLALTALAADEPAKPKIEDHYPAANHVPDSMKHWDEFQTNGENDAPADEPMGGFTAAGTPVNKRMPHCFPAEQRNLFWEVDQVVNEKTGNLEPFDYRGPPDMHLPYEKNLTGLVISNGAGQGRDAIRGQNTWMLWAEGNEVFWNWLQQDGYGLADFLILLDSRRRGERFKNTGMMNQPGMKANFSVNELGLYLDAADGERIRMTQPKAGNVDTDIDTRTGQAAVRPAPGPALKHTDPKHTQLFEPYDAGKFSALLASLPQDGVDPQVYGYPSGVVGLRLFPNPDYFAGTPAAEKARRHWKEVVIDKPDNYYSNASVAADPTLVRPFRVGMACAFCHVGPHPLNPPGDVESPGWANMSSVIGNQYWKAETIFANLTQSEKNVRAPDPVTNEPAPTSFLRQFLASQQPGTIDTSLVSTDHINNANTIISIFDVPARLFRAAGNSPEEQGPANLLLNSVEEANPGINPRHTPRVLIDGADSVGAYGALARVYLNIGTHSDLWATCHNPVIGFRPQRPFSIATLKKKSAYWNSADEYRIPALKAFFTYVDLGKNKNIASPMKLKYAVVNDASGKKDEAATQQLRSSLAAESGDATLGRAVFVDNCAICHSSKQPAGFDLKFSRDWSAAPAPQPGGAMELTLPADYADWAAFTRGKAFGVYRDAIRAMAQGAGTETDSFIEGNFLSSEVRIPVTLVGTNSARAVATNAMRGQVWDNFSSETYKKLPAVGPVPFFNPFSHAPLQDDCCNNDYYFPPPGGPGYYRPASLISLWATAPFLHNNTLGKFTRDPSVGGRLEAFDDAINRLFWREYREKQPTGISGDLRSEPAFAALAKGDPGFIYRTTEPTNVEFNHRFVRPLLVGILGEGRLGFLTLWLWVTLAVVFLVLAIFARARHLGFVLTTFAVLVSALLVIGKFDRIWWELWLVPAALVGAAVYFFLARGGKLLPALVFVALAAGSAWTGYVANGFAHGERGGVSLGPIPRGVPVSLIMNMNPEAPLGKTLRAATALVRGIILAKHETSDAARLKVFQDEAGQALLEASKCPDFVLDRGHWFAEHLTDDEKRQLKAFLKTL